eukprot:12508708-Alexandrium_andersonii.AAC.1
MQRRSVIDAATLIRRSIELVEPKQHQSLHLLFIDWEKAFDKAHPEAIADVLRRFRLLSHPLFRVDMDGELS